MWLPVIKATAHVDQDSEPGNGGGGQAHLVGSRRP